MARRKARTGTRKKGCVSRLLKALGIVQFTHRISAHAMWTGAILLFALCSIALYALLIRPYTVAWQGIFGDARYPEGYSIRGIDISHHQGKIDWDALSAAEVDGERLRFVFVKATEGANDLDNRFNSNFKQARDNGFVRGAYHFFLPNVSARQQADNFVRRVPLEEGDLPPVLDIESTGKLTPSQLRDSALVWLRLIERRYGAKPILYTYYKFKTEYLGTPEFSKYPYWIAHYYVDTLRYDGPWKFWQHTDRGRLKGIKGYVDINCYNGSMYDLQQLTLK